MEELHVGILIIAACVIVYADHEAYLYLSGRVPLLDRRRTTMLHHAVWALLAGMILTGTLLASRSWSYFLSDPLFVLKLCLVGLLVANSFVINALMAHAFEVPFAQLSAARRRALIASGAASAIGWIGAASLGLYLFG